MLGVLYIVIDFVLLYVGEFLFFLFYFICSFLCNQYCGFSFRFCDVWPMEDVTQTGMREEGRVFKDDTRGVSVHGGKLRQM